MSPVEAAVVRGVVAPAVSTGLLLLVTGGLEPRRRERLQGPILGLGFALGAWLLLEHLAWLPADVNESFTYVALLLGLFSTVGPRAHGPRYAARALVVGCGLALVTWHIRSSLASGVAARNLAAFFCLSLGTWSFAEGRRARVGAPALLVAGMAWALATSVTALFFGSAVVANLAGTLTGQIGAALAVALVRPGRLSVESVLPFATAGVGLFAAAAHFYLDVNPWYLIVAAWPMAVVGLRGLSSRPASPWREAGLVGLFSLGPLGGWLAWLHSVSGPLY